MRYRIHLICPRCDKESEIVASIMAAPRVRCDDCLLERVEIVEMKIVAAEQLEGQQ
jgi:DNA-directed RNA polymerase subunit RPC12/RpoP